jgi:hypothetical protein
MACLTVALPNTTSDSLESRKAGEGRYCDEGGGMVEFWRGDLSCPPSGKLDFVSLGKRIDPKGDTAGFSTFNHDPNFGA